jgi:CheY-like chemotaxis protein
MKKILIIEDDISIRELLVDVLEQKGYLVFASVNGADGIKSLEQGTPDLILMDVAMPIMDGYAFRKEVLLNSNWNKIPVIAMSSDHQCDKKLSEHGINNFISKPLNIVHLLNTIKSIA